MPDGALYVLESDHETVRLMTEDEIAWMITEWGGRIVGVISTKADKIYASMIRNPDKFVIGVEIKVAEKDTPDYPFNGEGRSSAETRVDIALQRLAWLLPYLHSLEGIESHGIDRTSPLWRQYVLQVAWTYKVMPTSVHFIEIATCLTHHVETGERFVQRTKRGILLPRWAVLTARSRKGGTWIYRPSEIVIEHVENQDPKKVAPGGDMESLRKALDNRWHARVKNFKPTAKRLPKLEELIIEDPNLLTRRQHLSEWRRAKRLK